MPLKSNLISNSVTSLADLNTPAKKKYDGTPAFLCFLFEWAVSFVAVNHMVGGLAIALARLYYLFQGNKLASYIKERDQIRSYTTNVIDKNPRYQLDLCHKLILIISVLTILISEFKEDTLLKILYWYSPALSATLATMNMTESLAFYGEENFLFHFRDWKRSLKCLST